MSDLANGLVNDKDKTKNKDTLFGPNIGVVSVGPDWCESKDKLPQSEDELTPEIVKSWIAKSREVSTHFLSSHNSS